MPRKQPDNDAAPKPRRGRPRDPERYQRIFGSYHAGICQFVFCDGSVHPLSNTTAPRTLQLLAVRNDGQLVPEN